MTPSKKPDHPRVPQPGPERNEATTESREVSVSLSAPVPCGDQSATADVAASGGDAALGFVARTTTKEPDVASLCQRDGEADTKPASKSKTDVMRPCSVCGDLTTRIVQSGGKFLPWCERHDAGPRDGEAQIL